MQWDASPLAGKCRACEAIGACLRTQVRTVKSCNLCQILHSPPYFFITLFPVYHGGSFADTHLSFWIFIFACILFTAQEWRKRQNVLCHYVFFHPYFQFMPWLFHLQMKMKRASIHRAKKILAVSAGKDFSLWSGWWESNPPLKLGKLAFYQWTTPARWIYFVWIDNTIFSTGLVVFIQALFLRIKSVGGTKGKWRAFVYVIDDSSYP